MIKIIPWFIFLCLPLQAQIAFCDPENNHTIGISVFNDANAHAFLRYFDEPRSLCPSNSSLWDVPIHSEEEYFEPNHFFTPESFWVGRYLVGNASNTSLDLFQTAHQAIPMELKNRADPSYNQVLYATLLPIASLILYQIGPILHSSERESAFDLFGIWKSGFWSATVFATLACSIVMNHQVQEKYEILKNVQTNTLQSRFNLHQEQQQLAGNQILAHIATTATSFEAILALADLYLTLTKRIKALFQLRPWHLSTYMAVLVLQSIQINTFSSLNDYTYFRVFYSWLSMRFFMFLQSMFSWSIDNRIHI